MDLLIVPKRTVRLHRSAHLFTPIMAANARILRGMHPEWQHLLFNYKTARDFVTKHFPCYLELFDFYPMDIQRAHLFRWLVLKMHGGVWLDVMIRAKNSLDEMIAKAPIVLLIRSNLSTSEFESVYRKSGFAVNQNWMALDCLVACSKDHWFIDKVIDVLIDRAGYLDGREPGEEEIYFTSGSGAMSAACQLHWERLRDEVFVVQVGAFGKSGDRKKAVELGKWASLQKGYNDPESTRILFRE